MRVRCQPNSMGRVAAPARHPVAKYEACRVADGIKPVDGGLAIRFSCRDDMGIETRTVKWISEMD